MPSLLDKRFSIIAGKGGVGKTTLATALALAAASRGKRVLIAQFDTNEKIGALFGRNDVGYQPVELSPNVFTAHIRPEQALREYGLMKLKFKRVFKMVFENELVKRLLDMIPGMDELVLIGKAWYLERARDSQGKPVWDMIIVDSPATGHGVTLFNLPHVILSAVSVGPLAQETKQIVELLTDPARATMHIVTLAEEMPFNECLELREAQRDLLKIPDGMCLVNGVYSQQFSPLERERLERWHHSTAPEARSTDVDAVLAATYNYASRSKMQQGYLARYRKELDLPVVEIPQLFCSSVGRNELEWLSNFILGIENQ